MIAISCLGPASLAKSAGVFTSLALLAGDQPSASAKIPVMPHDASTSKRQCDNMMM